MAFSIEVSDNRVCQSVSSALALYLMIAIPGKSVFTSVESNESLLFLAPSLVNQHRRFTHIGSPPAYPPIAPYLRGQDTGYLLLSCV